MTAGTPAMKGFAMNIAHKIISAHLVEGDMVPGKEIGLRVDQTLTQDATGTMAWLQFEALRPAFRPHRTFGELRGSQYPADGVPQS